MDLVVLLRQHREKLLRSEREYRLENDHSITVRGSEWYDHDSRQGGHVEDGRATLGAWDWTVLGKG